MIDTISFSASVQRKSKNNFLQTKDENRSVWLYKMPENEQNHIKLLLNCFHMNDNTWNCNWFVSTEDRERWSQISLKYSRPSTLRINASLEACLSFLVYYMVFTLYFRISVIHSQSKACGVILIVLNAWCWLKVSLGFITLNYNCYTQNLGCTIHIFRYSGPPP